MEILVLVFKWVVGAAVIGFFGKMMWKKYKEMKSSGGSGSSGSGSSGSGSNVHLE